MEFFKKIVLLISIVTVFVTCKKEQLAPTTIEGQPVFSFSGSINGTPLTLQAGINNYYMYSSYNYDSLGVYNFTGTLKSTSNNLNSIQIIINDDTVVPLGALSNIGKSVIPATYYYNIPGGNSIWDSVTFVPKIYKGAPASFLYNFGDGGSVTKIDTSRVTHVYKKLQDFSTSLTMDFYTCGPQTIINPINLKKQATTPLTIDSIHFQLDSILYKVTLTSYITGGTPPYTYAWSYGNGTTPVLSGSSSVTYTYAGPAQTYVVALAMDDSQNDTAVYSCSIRDTVSNNCRMDYYALTPKAIQNPNALSNVTVNYIDGLGNKYTSNNASQPYNNTFQITSVANYQTNINNQSTKMLKVTFNCTLYPVLGGAPITASNCSATIAVAYH